MNKDVLEALFIKRLLELQGRWGGGVGKISLVPRCKREGKGGPGTHCIHMHLIAVTFHGFSLLP